MDSIAAFPRRHPWVIDLLLIISAAALIGISSPRSEQRGAAEWLLLAAIIIPLFWRRRAPALTFWTVFALFSVADVLTEGLEATFIALLIAVYALARHRSRRYLAPAGAALAAMIVITAQFEDDVIASIVASSAILAAAMLLGIYRQTRRAYLDGLIERAERLERERDRQARLAVIAERSRIAREMHDIIAHNVAVMVALAEGAAYSATRSPENSAAAMTKVSETGRQALGEMRRLLSVLRDTEGNDDSCTPTPQPSIADLPDLVAQVRLAGQQVTLHTEGDPISLTPGAELAAYRIVQEALTNAMKHAGPAAAVDVRLTYSSTGLEIDVADDGAGQRANPPAPHTSGQGLPGMVHRAASYGGSADVGPGDDAGWHVHARLPITQSPADSGATSAASMSVDQ